MTRKYENEFLKSLLSNPINYNIVSEILQKFSETEEFKTEIKTYIPDLSNSKDIFIETLAWYTAFQNRPIESSLESQLRVYELYPYLIYSIMFLRTIDQQREYFQKILDLYKDTRGIIKEDQFGKNIKIYQSYLDNYETNFKKNSSLVNMNYLAGIRFDQINIPFDQLPKNYLVINIGYKSNVKEGEIISKNILYNDIKSIENITVKYSDVENIHSNTKTNIYSRNECYKIITKNKTDLYKIIINYNNDIDDKKCLYSISKNDVPLSFINILTHGGTIYKVKNQSLRVYFSEILTQRFKKTSNNQEIKKEIDDIISNISVLLREKYSESVDQTIRNWTGFNNDKIFDLWLYKLYEFDTFDEITKKHVLNYNNYVCMIKAYFMPIDDYVD